MKRSTPLRRTRMRRSSRPSRYKRRPRDLAFLRWVKTLLCSVIEEWPNKSVFPGPCSAVVEADHAGDRGLGQKCPDTEAIPLCTTHHRQRTDHSGAFKYSTKAELREWRARAIQRTQTLWLEHTGAEVTW